MKIARSRVADIKKQSPLEIEVGDEKRQQVHSPTPIGRPVAAPGSIKHTVPPERRGSIEHSSPPTWPSGEPGAQPKHTPDKLLKKRGVDPPSKTPESLKQKEILVGFS